MYFEVVTTDTGYQARIKDGNHEIIFTTQVYASKQSALHACNLVEQEAGGGPIYEVSE
jgi:uncharacterized protein YegP (UPF0339 family)